MRESSKAAFDARLEAHCRALSKCRACGLGNGIVPILSGARRPRAMLVGQAPGQVEAAGGRPFAGRAGKTLFRWLERVGLSEATFRDRVYIAAVTRCYPGPSASGRGDRVPSREEQERCERWLTDEFEIIRPALIIPVGKLAIARFLPEQPLDQLIGQSFEITHNSIRTIAIPLPHPSGASSWIHQGNHPELLDRALTLIAGELAKLGVTPSAGARSVA